MRVLWHQRNAGSWFNGMLKIYDSEEEFVMEGLKSILYYYKSVIGALEF